jgi:ANTAR domain-containing protein/GAF domain-containing protein
MSDADERIELEVTFSELALGLFAAGTVQGTLQRIVDLAERAVEGCEGAGIFTILHGVVTTPAASGDLVVTIDQLQLEADEGPCLDAAGGGAAVYAIDLLDDGRWPAFGPAAVAAGVRSIAAYPLSATQQGALNLYSRFPAAFGVTDRAQGQLFATLARLALESASARAADELRSENLIDALRTRELIGQAQGILMERDRITAAQAFEVLKRASQHMNLKLREIAETVVRSGESSLSGPDVRGAARKRGDQHDA